MGKALNEMTLEELWDLFPIFLIQHQEHWKEWYLEEESRIHNFLPLTDKIRIHHIGSTAINKIWAKPIIDILVEIPTNYSMKSIKEIFVENGYICMSEEKNRMDFNKGYTDEGFAEKVFHLHLRYLGDNNELYFRDYMNDHSDLAKQYEVMKLSLWKKFEHDRDSYTNAKGQFISECTEKAIKKYLNRY
ncbi:GrpB family protein [Lacrimispora sp. 38-1]|uniref:GrpB family protein n=1 Tax=Lacrimispora sp. 38-1 TaxID=3125778 RepID=UPI003CE72DEA